MQRIDLQPAYVLHQRAYGDTSAIIELFTPEYGRTSVLAKGIKRPKSRWLGQLRAFQPVLVSWRGRTELMTLTHVEISGEHLHMPGGCLSSGLYMNELLMRLLHKHVVHIELFSYYAQAIGHLGDLSDGVAQRLRAIQAILRGFEINMLRELGYEMLFKHEASSEIMINPALDYNYRLDLGPVSLLNNPLNNDDVGVSGKTLLALSEPEKLVFLDDSTVFRQAKLLMRSVLARHLGDKPIYSRELFVSKV